MRLHYAAMAVGLMITPPAMAQSVNSAPLEQGNRANGKNYQPTPAEVAPREKAAGVAPPAARETAENQDLEQIDKKLLREEGVGDKSVPKMTTRP